MSAPKKIIAICGSTRASSTNLNLIQAITSITSGRFAVSVFTGLAAIPHFNPDLDTEGAVAPEAVAAFRQQLREADGILICTPEYAMGVPGSLKNALDWTVSSCEFSHKPTALITASSLGHKAHAALLETLKVIESDITPETQLVISYARTKVSTDGSITDTATLQAVETLLAAFARLMD